MDVRFKVEEIRSISSPYKGLTSGSSNETIYYLLVNMKDLPDNLPMDVNPRKPKMTTSIGRALKKAVTEAENDFYINNRGIVISAENLAFDGVKNEVVIGLGDQDNEDDRSSYGILDGGHTYTAIISERDKIPNGTNKYVRVEVITNVQNIYRLSDARNTSVEVSDIALFNLDGQFDKIRDVIASTEYANKIAYKDNENNEDKPIHISELLRLMYAFDIDEFPNDKNAPVQSYSYKSGVFKRYKKAHESDFYKYLITQIPTLVNLYEKILVKLPEYYAKYKEDEGSKAKFGLVRGIEASDDRYTPYTNQKMKYSIPDGYIYPILGAFRCLLEYDSNTKTGRWLKDPLDMLDLTGSRLTQNVFESSNSPLTAGKDKQIWLGNYRIVKLESLLENNK